MLKRLLKLIGSAKDVLVATMTFVQILLKFKPKKKDVEKKNKS